MSITQAENPNEGYIVTVGANSPGQAFTTGEAITSIVEALKMFQQYDNSWSSEDKHGFLSRKQYPYIEDEVYRTRVPSSALESGVPSSGSVPLEAAAKVAETSGGIHPTSLTGFPRHMLRILEHPSVQKWVLENPNVLQTER